MKYMPLLQSEAMARQDTGGQLYYWRTPSGTEVDFIWTRARHALGVEVKATSTWRTEYGAPLKSLITQGSLHAAYGVYVGDVELKDGALRILPIERFLKELASGNILAPGRGT